MKDYKIYFVYKNGREHGSYTSEGKNKIDALRNFLHNYSTKNILVPDLSKHKIRSLGRRDGYPKDSAFYRIQTKINRHECHRHYLVIG